MSRGRRTAGFLTILLAGAGVLHAARPEHFDRIVPRQLPGPARVYTLTSGAAELLVAGMIAHPRTRRTGGYAAAALLVAVFPANLTMEKQWRSLPARKHRIALARLPLQAVLIAQSLHVARRAET